MEKLRDKKIYCPYCGEELIRGIHTQSPAAALMHGVCKMCRYKFEWIAFYHTDTKEPTASGFRQIHKKNWE